MDEVHCVLLWNRAADFRNSHVARLEQRHAVRHVLLLVGVGLPFVDHLDRMHLFVRLHLHSRLCSDDHKQHNRLVLRPL